MIVNYHTHTARCGHADGADREYVETAIGRGLKTLGFSDHVPMPFPDGHESGFRIPIRKLEDYVQSVLSLREEFQNDIEILLGFEAEYYPDLFVDLQDLLSPYPVDYLLLGQHFNDSREAIYNSRPQSDANALTAYVDQVIAGMETGCFTYVAHPDLFRFKGPDAIYEQEMRRVCRSAYSMNIPLEINILGLRQGRNYPDDRFWTIAAQEKCKVILGCDAHTPEDVAHPDQLRNAMNYAARFGLVPETETRLRKPF